MMNPQPLGSEWLDKLLFPMEEPSSIDQTDSQQHLQHCSTCKEVQAEYEHIYADIRKLEASYIRKLEASKLPQLLPHLLAMRERQVLKERRRSALLQKIRSITDAIFEYCFFLLHTGFRREEILHFPEVSNHLREAVPLRTLGSEDSSFQTVTVPVGAEFSTISNESHSPLHSGNGESHSNPYNNRQSSKRKDRSRISSARVRLVPFQHTQNEYEKLHPLRPPFEGQEADLAQPNERQTDPLTALDIYNETIALFQNTQNEQDKLFLPSKRQETVPGLPSERQTETLTALDSDHGKSTQYAQNRHFLPQNRFQNQTVGTSSMVPGSVSGSHDLVTMSSPSTDGLPFLVPTARPILEMRQSTLTASRDNKASPSTAPIPSIVLTVHNFTSKTEGPIQEMPDTHCIYSAILEHRRKYGVVPQCLYISPEFFHAMRKVTEEIIGEAFDSTVRSPYAEEGEDERISLLCSDGLDRKMVICTSQRFSIR